MLIVRREQMVKETKERGLRAEFVDYIQTDCIAGLPSDKNRGIEALMFYFFVPISAPAEELHLYAVSMDDLVWKNYTTCSCFDNRPIIREDATLLWLWNSLLHKSNQNRQAHEELWRAARVLNTAHVELAQE